MYAALIFCSRCNSQSVDVYGWRGDVAQVRCMTCGQEGRMEGFSLGRGDIAPVKIALAQADIARNRRMQPLLHPHANGRSRS